jgi:hypothetical protein
MAAKVEVNAAGNLGGEPLRLACLLKFPIAMKSLA